MRDAARADRTHSALSLRETTKKATSSQAQSKTIDIQIGLVNIQLICNTDVCMFCLVHSLSPNVREHLRQQCISCLASRVCATVGIALLVQSLAGERNSATGYDCPGLI